MVTGQNYIGGAMAKPAAAAAAATAATVENRNFAF